MKENNGEKENRQIVELLSGQSAPYVEIEQRRKDRFRSFGVAITLSLCVLFAIYFICGYFVGDMEKEDVPIQADVPKEEINEWVGAFLSRDISEECLEVSVRIRAGAAGEYGARGVSGVVVGSDGWIATSNTFLDSGQKGRIYVLLSDGREYAVDKIVRDDDLALLKIDADGLNVVRFEKDIDVCLGQSVFALSSGGAPEHNSILSSGIVSGIDGEVIRTDIDLLPSGAGSPIFDEQGRLLGLWLEEDGRVFGANKLIEKMQIIK